MDGYIELDPEVRPQAGDRVLVIGEVIHAPTAGQLEILVGKTVIYTYGSHVDSAYRPVNPRGTLKRNEDAMYVAMGDGTWHTPDHEFCNAEKESVKGMALEAAPALGTLTEDGINEFLGC